MSKLSKQEKRILALAAAFALTFGIVPNVSAMHIMEGYLPGGFCIAWGVLCLPFLIAGFLSIKKTLNEHRNLITLLAMSGAFIFVISSLKIPSVTGSCSHMTGTGLGAILFGPSAVSILGLIVLLFQAILLAHGGDENHIPIHKKELSAMGYDYVALGHIHKPQALEENRMVYAGALEPTDTGDLGPHGYVAGELTEEGCRTRFVPVALREYRELSVQADPAMTGYQVKEKIREAIEEGGTEHMYLVQIAGYRDPEIRFDLSGMDVYGNIVEIADETRPSYAFERLLEQNRENFLGSYIESFLGAEEDSAEYQALCEGVCALMETRAD